MNASSPDSTTLERLLPRWRSQAQALGFTQFGVARLADNAELSEAVDRLQRWVADGQHGDMTYLDRHASLRRDPSQLVPGARSAIMVALPYIDRPGDATRADWEAALADPDRAVVSRYAWGRDYHKVLRRRLQQLADGLQADIGPFGHRVFVDSGPVMEVELARQAGLGWRGKHTLLLGRQGSWFFLGTLLTDLELPLSEPVSAHCGSCQRCLDVCPTRAFTGPYQLDARRCISYLTIEHAGPIPEPLRPLMGNRVYGCDDCQAVCPWNSFAQAATEADFAARHRLDQATLLELWAWDETTFLARTEGSAIRRIGFERWRRNLAVALGNSGGGQPVVQVLQASREQERSFLVREHIDWALKQLQPPENASA